jgi:uncharacterized metal-binding protein
LVYACSGGANTGLLADQVARTLDARGEGKMTCLAAVGANLSGFTVSAQAAANNIVIDGCPVGCGARMFTEKELPFDHFVTTDFGVTKGETPITEELIDSVADQIVQRIK